MPRGPESSRTLAWPPTSAGGCRGPRAVRGVPLSPLPRAACGAGPPGPARPRPSSEGDAAGGGVWARRPDCFGGGGASTVRRHHGGPAEHGRRGGARGARGRARGAAGTRSEPHRGHPAPRVPRRRRDSRSGAQSPGPSPPTWGACGRRAPGAGTRLMGTGAPRPPASPPHIPPGPAQWREERAARERCL